MCIGITPKHYFLYHSETTNFTHYVHEQTRCTRSGFLSAMFCKANATGPKYFKPMVMRFSKLCLYWLKLKPGSKVHGANMGPIWGRQYPGGPHVGLMNFVILVRLSREFPFPRTRPQAIMYEPLRVFVTNDKTTTTNSLITTTHCKFVCIGLLCICTEYSPVQ